MTGANMTRQELIDAVWHASNLTRAEATQLIDEAISLGRAQAIGWPATLRDHGQAA